LSVSDKSADGFSDLVKWDTWKSDPDGERMVILEVNMEEKGRNEVTGDG
jgi:hypothetical protein